MSRHPKAHPIPTRHFAGRASWIRTPVAVVAAFGLITCTDQPTEPLAPAVATKGPALSRVAGHSAASVVLVGAGNIARCDREFDEQTGALLDAIPGTVFTVGDNTYGPDYANCYSPSWGRHTARTRPAPGEGDYPGGNGSSYFDYFGAAAGDPALGYYSYDAGNWHVIVLNSSVSMSPTSAQVQWLRQDLAATTRPCVLAYWHFPRFSSFSTGARSEVKPLWDALYEAQADVIVNAHYRVYERFGLQTPDEQADPELGIRQFTVGTGGQGLDALGGFTAPRPNSEVRRAGTYGVLKLSLNEYTYAWEFVPVPGQTFTDVGDAACHGRPNGPPPPNQAPTANTGGPYNAEKTVTFDASASRDVDNHLPLTYAWTFGDGTSGSGVSPTKTYASDGSYTATLIVTDAKGLASTPVTTTVTIANVAPQVSAGADASVQVGTAFTMNGTFTDEGGAADGPWSWTIAWGDGTTSSGTATTLGAPINVSHTYTSFGEYTASLTAADRDGASSSDDAIVTVRDANSVAVLVGAGDIAECGNLGAERTARLLDNIPGTVIALGDNAYLAGSAEDYANCYHPTWGRHKARTRPAPGNHDYDGTPGAAGYYGYFGEAAGDPQKGYYSYHAGEWLVVVLNSASGSANRSATSAQVQWLRELLATTARECVVAYMHHPQFTSAAGRTSGEWNVIDLWNTLYEGGVELVLAGHDHLYERFAPMRPDGTLDSQFGIRQITNGAGGGEGLYNFGGTHPNSQARSNATFGVVKVTLRGGSYSWQFVPVAGGSYTDTGNGTCHGRPGGPAPANQAPTPNAGGPYVSEGTIHLNASASSDPDGNLPLTYYWTFGDGTVGSGVNPAKTYTSNGTYTVTVTVTDALGKSSAPASATVTIKNQPPVANAGADRHAFLNTPFTLNATFTDPGGSTDGPWSWSVAWGDGTASTGSTNVYGGPITATHTFPGIDEYMVRVTVTDKDGGFDQDEKLVTVTPSNHPPIAVPGGPYQSDRTVTFDGSASSDPDGHVPLTYAWNFGDGTSGSGASPTKTYAADGSYTVNLVVTDALGVSSAPVTTGVTIANSAPDVKAGGDATVQTGSAFTLDATFTDASGADDGPWSWSIAWGDGTTTTGTATSLGGPITRSHVYGALGQYTVRLTVTDSEGNSGSDEARVTVSGVVIVGAGNIARCDRAFDEQTATLLDAIAGTVFTVGDNVYGGEADDFTDCYGPSWGRHASRTRPAPGDIEYVPAGATGYYGYFGASAGDPTSGYYSYDLGNWHVVVLNNRLSASSTSPQVTWLKADLAATTKQCILAYWHFPRFSSSGTSVRTEIKPIWDALYEAGADVVINAHSRVYERFAPQTPTGAADPVGGIRQFTVGTGGQGADSFGTPRPNSEARATGVYGVLKLSLDATSYSWEFVPIAGQTFTDSGGSVACHGRP